MTTEKPDNTNPDNLDLNLFWKKILARLELELSPAMYNTWIIKLVPQKLDDNILELSVPDIYAQKQIKRYESLINDAVDKVAGKKFKIILEIKKEEVVIKDETELGPLFIKNIAPKADTQVILKAGLRPHYNFETFIVGSSNQLAYAVAQAVAENPGTTYNPLFLYSGVGLGKTHLVQAIGNRVLQKNPKMNVVYTTGESFMNELIETIQSGKGRGKYTSGEFRKKYRKSDVLIIDDIQFIIGRDTTQMEFFHTFNELHMAGKQIVLTSDRPPNEFVNLEKRITSRFGSGIIADIQYPDLDHRIAILRTKRDLSRDDISNTVIDFIAKSVTTNIRELEGAYLQVKTMANATGQPPTLELAETILGKNGNIGKTRSLTIHQVLKTVSKYYSVKIADIKGQRRTKDIVLPRQVAMYLMRMLTPTPLEGIGEILGGRDHTTVLYGVEKIEKEMLEMGKIRSDVNNVKQLL